MATVILFGKAAAQKYLLLPYTVREQASEMIFEDLPNQCVGCEGPFEYRHLDVSLTIAGEVFPGLILINGIRTGRERARD